MYGSVMTYLRVFKEDIFALCYVSYSSPTELNIFAAFNMWK